MDIVKWNQCVYQNPNGLIYATTTYLNAMCVNWHAIIVNDYAAVMPLPWLRKWGIRYGYTPAFTQQLGVFGELAVNDWEKITTAIKHFFSYGDIQFNYANRLPQQLSDAESRTNYIIHLEKGYDAIYAAYRNDLKESIKKAEALRLHYAETETENAIRLYQMHYSERTPHITHSDYDRFSALCHTLQLTNQCFSRGCFTTDGELLAIGVFLKDQHRIYNLMNTTLLQGREKKANHFLLNNLIQEFAKQPLLFDFEGSSLPGVKQFYESFNPVAQPFFRYHFNKLPWPLRLLKR